MMKNCDCDNDNDHVAGGGGDDDDEDDDDDDDDNLDAEFSNEHPSFLSSQRVWINKNYRPHRPEQEVWAGTGSWTR